MQCNCGAGRLLGLCKGCAEPTADAKEFSPSDGVVSAAEMATCVCPAWADASVEIGLTSDCGAVSAIVIDACEASTKLVCIASAEGGTDGDGVAFVGESLSVCTGGDFRLISALCFATTLFVPAEAIS